MESILFLSRRSFSVDDLLEEGRKQGLNGEVRALNDACLPTIAVIRDDAGRRWEISEVKPGDDTWAELEDDARRVVEDWRAATILAVDFRGSLVDVVLEYLTSLDSAGEVGLDRDLTLRLVPVSDHEQVRQLIYET